MPSINALVEKIKIGDAGLEDWVLEMVKVLLLASMAEPDLNRVLLFDHVEATSSTGSCSATMPARCRARSPRTSGLAARTQARPKPTELRIDRVWGIAAVQQMMRGGN